MTTFDLASVLIFSVNAHALSTPDWPQNFKEFSRKSFPAKPKQSTPSPPAVRFSLNPALFVSLYYTPLLTPIRSVLCNPAVFISISLGRRTFSAEFCQFRMIESVAKDEKLGWRIRHADHGSIVFEARVYITLSICFFAQQSKPMRRDFTLGWVRMPQP